MEQNETSFTILVNNKPDVLARIAGTFSARGFNIESISANTTSDPALTKIIITTRHCRETAKKIEKQLKNLVDVLRVTSIPHQRSVRREMLLVKMKANEDRAVEIERIIADKAWRVLKNDAGCRFLEITGGEEEIISALDLLTHFGIDEYTRTGVAILEMEKK